MDPKGAPSAHPLTFRVMRLTAGTPSRRPTMPFVCSTAHQPDVPDAFTRDAPAAEGEGAPASVGAISILPASFGSIYASETFRAFINTYNVSELPAHAVAVTVEMQTSSQRRIALLSTRTAVNLPSREALSHIVAVPLPELGVHALVCVATYQDRSGASRTLRQLFRFNVLPPLEPLVNVIPLHRKHSYVSKSLSSLSAHDCFESVHTRDAPGDKAAEASETYQMAQFLVDLRVLNTMPVPVYITSVKLNVNAPYSIVTALIRPDDRTAVYGDGITDDVKCKVYHMKSESSADYSGATQTSESDDASITIPQRSASTGVGDTKNFLFYVARNLYPHELSKEKRPGSPKSGGYARTRPSTSSQSAIDTSHTSRAALQDQDGPTQYSTASSLTRVQSEPKAEHADQSAHYEHEVDLLSANPSASRSVADEGRSPWLDAVRRQEIGCFSLQWHSGNGEYGSMNNVIVVFEPDVRSADVEILIEAVPQNIRVQIPFAAKCVARNNSDRPLRLYLQVRRDLVGEIVPVGMSGISLGEVAPASTAECLLTLLPLTRGLHSISGVRVVDIDSRKSFNADAPVISVI